jgi:hypothetical protein
VIILFWEQLPEVRGLGWKVVQRVKEVCPRYDIVPD